MKYKVWNVIQDNGDGSSSSLNFRSRQDIIDHYELPEDQYDDVYEGGCPFPEGDSVPLEISEDIFDTEGYEIIQ